MILLMHGITMILLMHGVTMVCFDSVYELCLKKFSF